MANHELVDISEGTTAWDLIHPTSVLSMMPIASPRRQKRHQADCKEPGSPSLGDSCPITQPVRLLQHHLQEPEKQGKPGPGSWPMRGEMKGDVKLMSGKGELRGCGRAQLTGVAATVSQQRTGTERGPGRSQTLGTFLPDGTITH